MNRIFTQTLNNDWLSRLAGVSAAMFFLLCFFSAGTRAQSESGSGTTIPGAFAGLDASAALSSFSRVDNKQTDVFFGSDSRGPYRLSWKGFSPDGITVQRGAVTLTRDKDYTINLDTGTLLFTDVLTTGEMARVIYRCDSPTLARNVSPMSLPFQWDVLQAGGNQLTMRSLMTPDSTNPDSMKAQNWLQYTNLARLNRSSSLNTGIFMDLNGGNMLDHGGLKVADSTRWKNSSIGLSYSRAGALFNQTDTTGLTAGKEIMELNGSWDLYKNLTLSSMARQASDILESGIQGSGSHSFSWDRSLKFAFPKNLGAVAANRSTVQTDAADGSHSTVTNDSIKVDRTLYAGTSAAVGYESQTTGGTNVDRSTVPAAYGQKATVDLKSKVSSQVTLGGSFANSTGSYGAEDDTGLQVEAMPISYLKTLKLIAIWNDRYRLDGVSRNRQANLELPPLPFGKTQISGGVQQTTDPGKERVTGSINATSKPIRYLELNGGLKLREGTINSGLPDPDAVNGYKMKFALAPRPWLQFTHTLSRNPDADDGTLSRVEARSYGLETTLGRVKLKGSYGTEDAYLESRILNTMEFGFNWKFSRFTSIEAAYLAKTNMDAGLTDLTTYSLLFQHQFNSLLNFSLGGKMTLNGANNRVNWSDSEMQAQASLGIKF